MASSKRERELARMRAERQAARRAAAEARRRKRRATLLAVTSAVAVVAVVVGVAIATSGGTKKDTVTSPASPSATTGSTATPGPGGAGTCAYSKSGTASRSVPGLPAGTGVRTSGTQKAVLQTSRGAIQADLLTSKAPCTVNSFAFLAAHKYFDGTPCHRLTTTGIYVLQCGDPSGTGSGGPGYKFADENLTGAVYPKGTLAMANAGPGTNGSQFFLVYKDTQLPPSYTPFGIITKGLDILTTVAKAGSTPPGDGKPKLAVTLTKVRVA